MKKCRGVALLEAIVSLAIFVSLVGSVAYASRIALTVMTGSMSETKLLFRVRRVLDQAEEALSRCSSVSLVALTEDGWTLAGLENWFEQKAVMNEGQPIGDAAAQVLEDLKASRNSLLSAADFEQAELELVSAMAGFEQMVLDGYISPADALRLREAMTLIRLDILASSLARLGGAGNGIPDAWQDIEQAILDFDTMLPVEPVVAADQVLFRQYVLDAGGPEYRPPLDQPPYAYYLRPMRDTGLFELVFYDGTRSVVVANNLTDVSFARQNQTIRITLFFEEEVNGVMVPRTEVRSVILRVR